MNELAWRHHFPIISLWEIVRLQGQLTVVSRPIWPKFELVRDFMSSLPASIKRMREKQPRKGGDIIFPIIIQRGLSVAMETRVLIQSAPKPYAVFSPTPVVLHIKFDQDWPTGFKDIQVQKCEIFVTQGQVTPK